MAISLAEKNRFVPVTYHHVTDEVAPGLVRSSEELRQDLIKLRSLGYIFLTASQATSASTSNSLPEKVATITFDDGLRTQWEHALPVLKELGIPATFFIISSTLEGRIPPVMILQTLLNKLGAQRLTEILMEKLPAVFKELLSAEYVPLHKKFKGPEPDDMRPIKFVFNSLMPPQLAADILGQIFKEYITEQTETQLAQDWFMQPDQLMWLQDHGHEVGAHSVIHPLLYLLSHDQIKDQLVTSQQQIEYKTHGRPDSFAYPFGGTFSPEIISLVKETYQSGWNYLISLPENFQATFILKNLHDIPRVEGKMLFEENV